jgi:16S rRNA processing protein RimM
MRIDECFQLGTISRTHGKNGALLLKLDTDRPEAYMELESILLEIQGELVPFFIAELKPIKANAFQIFLEDIPPGEAERFVGKKVFLPLTMLPKLSGKQFYFHEVIGFRVLDMQYGEIGQVIDVIERHPQHVLVVAASRGEVLIPAANEIIVQLNREDQSIQVDCPEGLLDIYANS